MSNIRQLPLENPKCFSLENKYKNCMANDLTKCKDILKQLKMCKRQLFLPYNYYNVDKKVNSAGC